MLPTAQQIAFYNEQGYLKFGQVFSADEMAALREHVDKMIRDLPPDRRPEEMDTPHFDDPWLFRYLAHPRVLDVVERFIGPDIVLWSSHLIAKPRGDGRAVPWHTDGAYWGRRLAPMRVLTLWLAVDPSTRENGCMRVIPGSHKRIAASLEQYRAVDSRENVFASGIPSELIDEGRAVDLELAPGECHFHDAWTIHGSNANRSDVRRCGYTMRYMPADVVHSPAEGRKPHRIYLLRGEDRSGGRNHYEQVPTV
jgi:ectoine hydroxylase-related dioxygenase (phytanoyl-CoA dioxygenase family)